MRTLLMERRPEGAALALLDGRELTDHRTVPEEGLCAETVLVGEGRYLSATAAAGPCFEGANISSGMSASNGAVYEYRKGGA